ncbi:hypothetical protein D9615_006531 [Tricholomella constricta]|nr:hypothetical protein D9615_006531 [Tricholomella constricta]
MFLAGKPRSSEETLAEVKSQVKAACLGVAQTVKDAQTESGVKDAYTQYWIDTLIERARAMQKDNPTISAATIQAELMNWVHGHEDAIYNSFLTLDGFDVSRDTPVEILHTILLGVVKYLWHGSHTSWTTTQKKIYAVRLQATNSRGLSIHNIRANYIMQYANSLIGRQLKTLAQVNVFHVYDLIDPQQFQLTKAIGELSSLLWFPEIRNLQEYLSDIDVAVANVLDITALIDPSKVISKIKYHLLVHMREDIIRFGPLVGVATEVFESFNAIFRYCSILSNHLAPSRDIAYKMSALETMKHFLSGGWWKTGSLHDQWVQPGPSIRRFMVSNPVLQALCGWTDNKALIPGTVKSEPPKRGLNRQLLPQVLLPWAETAGSQAINNTPPCNDRTWRKCKYVVAQSEDQCVVGSWVFAKSPLVANGTPIPGQIIEILQDSSCSSALVVIDVFRVGSARDELFGMPVLSRPFSEMRRHVVGALNVLFEFNVQHDCCHSKCEASGERSIMQERIASGCTEAFIVHKEIDRYLINIHAFHNAHLIRATLPRDLTKPIPFRLNREEHHSTIAASLRTVQEAKRAKTAAQAAARKAKVAEKVGAIVPRVLKRRRMDEQESDGDEDIRTILVDTEVDDGGYPFG